MWVLCVEPYTIEVGSKWSSRLDLMITKSLVLVLASNCQPMLRWVGYVNFAGIGTINAVSIIFQLFKQHQAEHIRRENVSSALELHRVHPAILDHWMEMDCSHISNFFFKSTHTPPFPSLKPCFLFLSTNIEMTKYFEPYIYLVWPSSLFWWDVRNKANVEYIF